MGTMPMKIPKNTAAAAWPGSRFSFSKRAANCRARVRNLWITRRPLPSFARTFVCASVRHHRQLAARHNLAAHPHRTADVRHRPGVGQLLGFNAQFLARSHRLEKLEAVYGRQQDQLSTTPVSASGCGRSQHDARGLGHGFDQQDTRENGLGGKMPGKNRVFRIHELHGNTADAGVQFFDPVDPQERRAMRNHRLDFAALDHFGLYTSNVSAGIFGFTELMSMANTLFTPLLPSTSSDRSRKSRLFSFTTR